MDDGVQVVELLDEDEYRVEHLPGAVNIPLSRLGPDTTSELDPVDPVVVYCWDGL